MVSEEHARSSSIPTASAMESEAPASILDEATATISDEAMSLPASSGVSSIPDSGAQVHTARTAHHQSRPDAIAPGAGRVVAHDSLEMQEMEIKRLQEELENKKREVS